jgi:hypothetical protein
VSACPPAEIDTGWTAGLACVAPGCAVKLSVAGLAVNNVKPPTVIITRTVDGFDWLLWVATVKDVSYVPGDIDVDVFTVTSSGVGDPATVVRDPLGATDSHGAEFVVFTETLVAALEVTLTN